MRNPLKSPNVTLVHSNQIIRRAVALGPQESAASSWPAKRRCAPYHPLSARSQSRCQECGARPRQELRDTLCIVSFPLSKRTPLARPQACSSDWHRRTAPHSSPSGIATENTRWAFTPYACAASLKPQPAIATFAYEACVSHKRRAEHRPLVYHVLHRGRRGVLAIFALTDSIPQRADHPIIPSSPLGSGADATTVPVANTVNPGTHHRAARAHDIFRRRGWTDTQMRRTLCSPVTDYTSVLRPAQNEAHTPWIANGTDPPSVAHGGEVRVQAPRWHRARQNPETLHFGPRRNE